MIRIGIIGDIGSGKTFIANNFGYPVFNADYEVALLYKKNKNIFVQLNKKLPKFILSFPVKKGEIIDAILSDEKNLKKIISIVHKEIRKKLNLFLRKNRNSKIVILDIPLLIENKINDKSDILIFVNSKKKDIEKKIKKRSNFNTKIHNIFKKIQLKPSSKKKKITFCNKKHFCKKTC